MPIAITALKPGDVVFDAKKTRMGNTTVKQLSVWQVGIHEVDVEGGKVLASWNGNKARAFRAKNGKLPWSRTDPRKAKPNFQLEQAI